MSPFHMPGEPQGQAISRLMLIALIIGGLYVGRDILAPLSLALLLTVAALPVVDVAQRRGLPRVAVVIAVLLVAIGVIAAVLYVVLTQALILAEQMPGYETELRRKLSSISGTGSGLLESLTAMANRLGQVVSPTNGAPAQMVVLAQPASDPFGAVLSVLGHVLAPAAMVAVTLLLMAFLLIQREDVRDRLLRLLGTDEIHRSTRAMQDATDRVGRFLLMQLMVNAAFGTAMGLGLWGLGLPNAPLWGVLGFVLRFIPYLGAPLAALFPIIVAFATSEGWSMVLLVAGWFLLVDIIISYVAEPMLYGNSAGVTPLALILSSIFWASLWGPIGLILAPAITACLAILGRYVPAMGYLDIILGDREALSPSERFYQRLLAGDAAGAARLLNRTAELDNEVDALRVLVEPAIVRLAAERSSEDFGAGLAVRASRTLLTTLSEGQSPVHGVPDVQLVGAGGGLDRAAAAMGAAALRDQGFHAAVEVHGTGGSALAVLVVASSISLPRLGRMMAAVRRAAPTILVFAPVEDGMAAVAALDPRQPVIGTLSELLEATEMTLGVPVPQPEPVA